MSGVDRLLISDLQFHGHCGLSPAEREAGQRLSVDLELCYAFEGARAREISQDLPEGGLSLQPDYSQVAALVGEVGRKERFRLLEALAERLAQAILEQFSVSEVVLRLKKCHPPVEAIRGYFGVEIRRRLTDPQSQSK